MNPQSKTYAGHATELIEKFYAHSKAADQEDPKQREFLRGFMAAGISTGLIDKATFEQLVSSLHERVYGMSIQQKHHQRLINGEATNYFDMPPYLPPKR